jgi:hypothetical protein
MGYLEPVAVPDRYLEPPEPEEEWCEWCEEEYIYCDCQECENCGERGTCVQRSVEDESWWFCEECDPL